MQINILNDFELKDYNTFGISAIAGRYVAAHNISELFEAINYAKANGLLIHILGCGSNTIFKSDLSRYLIIHSNILGIEKVSANSIHERDLEIVSSLDTEGNKNLNMHEIVRVGAGENWDNFVKYCCDNNLAGLENLSYIPGTVGAAPVQNIGAYGVEVSSVIESVCAIDTFTMKEVVISNTDCEFTYRGSTFKNNKSLIITHVNFKLRTLTAKSEYSLQLGYGELAKVSPKPQTIQEVRDNVIKIRSSKLPDWHVIRNAGSFFQNPVVSVKEYQKVKDIFLNDYNIDNVPHYAIPNSENVKIPAGFLIDKLVMRKQNQSNNVYLWPSQNLVLCARDDASAVDIINYSEYIINTINNITSITLIPEVNIVGE